jgi:hypothetical protein
MPSETAKSSSQITRTAAERTIAWRNVSHKIERINADVIKHSAETLDQWPDSLRRRYPGQKIAVCLEQARGPLVYALLKYNFLSLYPINPKTLAKFREAFTPSRAKDDLGDTAYLADLLALHHDKLRPWLPDDEKTKVCFHCLRKCCFD